MDDRSFNFPKPFQFYPESRESAQRLTSKEHPNRIENPDFQEQPPTLLPKSNRSPPSKRLPNPGSSNLRHLKPADIQEINELEELARKDVRELVQNQARSPSKVQAESYALPAQFIPKTEEQDRELALKMQVLVDKLKEYKEKLNVLRDKNLDLAKTSYERSQEIEKMKYEREMLEDEFKQINAGGGKQGEFAIITRKGKNEDEERRKLEMKKELMLGIALVEGDFADFVGRQGKEQNLCTQFINRLFSFFYWFVLLKGDMKRIEANYDKSISAYFSFFKFLVNTSIILFAVYSYLMISHLIDESDDATETCGSGFPCWSVFSSFSTSEDIVYSASLFGLIVITLLAALVKWVRTDAKRRRAEIYGGSDIKLKNFAAMVFNSWDWQIKTETDSVDQIANLTNLLTTALKDEARLKEAANRTSTEKTKLFIRKIFGTIVYVILLLIGWSFIAIILVGEDEFIEATETGNDYVDLLISVVPKLGISFVNAFFPAMTIRLTALEGWDSPSFIVKLQIIRMYSAKILNVVLYALLNLELATNGSWFGSKPQIENSTSYTCKEDQVGVSLFLLVVSEAIVSKLIPLIIALINKVLGRIKKLQVWKKEIKVAEQVINIIYFESLVWIAFPFFPYVAFFAPIFLFLDFKFEYWRLRRLEVKPYEQTQASDLVIFIMRVYNGTMILALAYVSYFMTEDLNHLSECGPYEDGTIARDPLVENIENTVVLEYIWRYIIDYPPFFWVLIILVIAKIGFVNNYLKISLNFLEDREQETTHQIHELERTVAKLQKQINLNKKII